MNEAKQMIRFPAVAGSFYPNQADDLLRMTTELLNKNHHEKQKTKALIVPHAGFVFSGAVAAAAYSILETDISPIVFLIGSSHRRTFHGIAIDTSDAYVTPLGKIAVNTQITKTLHENNPLFTPNAEPHIKEHALEVQLPFLQTIYHNHLTIVPLLLGSASTEELNRMADALLPYFARQEVLFMITTDLSHYPPSDIAEETDHRTTMAICTGNSDILKETLKQEAGRNYPGYQTGMCSYKAVLLLQNITGHYPNTKFQLLKYQNSGYSTLGSNESVVGYAAISVTI